MVRLLFAALFVFCLCACVEHPVSTAASPALEQTSGKLLRAGGIARDLSDQDIDGFRHLVPPGAFPWLITGEQGQQSGLQLIQVYLRPDKETGELRRGKVVLLARRRMPGGKEWLPWSEMDGDGSHLGYSRSYAQVAIKGRGFDDVESEKDRNRPFWVTGQFSDADLIGLVNFVRSGSSIRPTTSVLPILSVVQMGDSVSVRLRQGSQEWTVLELRRTNSGWTVTGESFEES